MGHVERCDKTLPLNEMIFHVRKAAVHRVERGQPHHHHHRRRRHDDLNHVRSLEQARYHTRK